MDNTTLLNSHQFLSLTGFSLPPLHLTSIHASLKTLKSEYQFKKVSFLGKINGVRGNYYLARGDDKNFYSLDGITWLQLERVESYQVQYLNRIRGYFLGDPSFQYTFDNEHEAPESAVVAPVKRETDGEDGENEDDTNNEESQKQPDRRLTYVTEEARLSYVLEGLLFDTLVIPRGAYIKNIHDEIVANPLFEGLNEFEATKLRNYLHLREGVRLPQKSALEKSNLSPAFDFGDTLDEDVPTRSWTIQYDQTFGTIVGKSLLWPGYVFYHVPESNIFGSYYAGNGTKNYDLCFMLRSTVNVPNPRIVEEDAPPVKIVNGAVEEEE